MPTTTRKRTKSSVAKEEAVVEVSPKKAARKVPGSSPSKSAGKKNKAVDSHEHEQAPAKKAKKSPTKNAEQDAVKGTFKEVVSQIDKFGKVIQTKVLAPVEPAIVKKQDPKKKAIRKAIVNEVRRISNPDVLEDAMDIDATETLKPNQVKAKVKANKKMKKAGAESTKKAVVKQIDTLGEEGVSQLLHPIKSKKVAAGKKGKGKVVKAKPAAKVDTKVLAKKTLVELSDLVTPSIQYKPSAVKGKIESKSLKKVVQQEFLKATNVKEIKDLGEKGVKQLVANKVQPAAVKSPKKAKAGKKEKAM